MEDRERLRQDREARLQRRKENKEFGNYQVGEKRPRTPKDRPVKKRRRIDDSEDAVSGDFEDGESELSEEASDAKGIELSGKLNLVYEEQHMSKRIDKVKMVLKGLWKLAYSREDDSQNLFLYQKIGIPIEEELIEEYFCDDLADRLQLSPEHYQQPQVAQAMSIELDTRDLLSIEKCLIDSQGLYTGFFIYEGRKVNEKFSLIMKKISWRERQEIYGDTRGQQPRQSVKLCGYGINDEMGPFLIEGLIEVFAQHKLKEKVMATQNMRRLKFAKFSMTKTYTSKSIESLV